MSQDVIEWAGPTTEVLLRHLDCEPRVESPEDLARAVEKEISEAILDQRTQLWSGLLGKQVLYRHPCGVSL